MPTHTHVNESWKRKSEMRHFKNYLCSLYSCLTSNGHLKLKSVNSKMYTTTVHLKIDYYLQKIGNLISFLFTLIRTILRQYVSSYSLFLFCIWTFYRKTQVFCDFYICLYPIFKNQA